MSRRPLRVTGFTRFFIVMLFVAPLAYIGASYYNGQDGIKNLMQLLKIEDGASQENVEQPSSPATTEPVKVNEPPSTSNKELVEENLRLKEELEFKKKRNEELYLENEELKRKLESAEKVIEASKKQ